MPPAGHGCSATKLPTNTLCTRRCCNGQQLPWRPGTGSCSLRHATPAGVAPRVFFPRRHPQHLPHDFKAYQQAVKREAPPCTMQDEPMVRRVTGLNTRVPCALKSLPQIRMDTTKAKEPAPNKKRVAVLEGSAVKRPSVAPLPAKVSIPTNASRCTSSTPLQFEQRKIPNHLVHNTSTSQQQDFVTRFTEFKLLDAQYGTQGQIEPGVDRNVRLSFLMFR